MRMARGIDESGIESIAEAADVEVTSSPRPSETTARAETADRGLWV